MSWKKTLGSILSGAVVLVGSSISDRQQNPSAPPVTAGNVVPALAVGALVQILNKINEKKKK